MRKTTTDAADLTSLATTGSPQNPRPFDMHAVLGEADALHSAIPNLRYLIKYADTIDSTMNVVDFCADPSNHASLQPGLVLVAGTQTRGIGLSGPWVSETQDIKMTIVLPGASDLQQDLMVRIASALAGIETLRSVAKDAELPVAFKWPNDIYGWVNDDNGARVPRKVLGYLLASSFKPELVARMSESGYQIPEGLLLAGVGINLGEELVLSKSVARNGAEVPLRSFATSLEQLTGVLFSREHVIAEYIKQLDRFAVLAYTGQYRELTDLASPVLLVGPNREAEIDLKSSERIIGTIQEITPDALIVRPRGGSKTVNISLFDLARIFPEGYRTDL